MSNIIKSFLFIVVVISSFSCAPNRKLNYIQDQQADIVNEKNELVKTIVLKEPEYTLRPNDRILVGIFSLTEDKFNFLGKTDGKPEFEAKLDSQGQIELPVIGIIKVGGLSVDRAEKKIKSATGEYLKSPRVIVKVLNFNFTVMGEVTRQGTYNVVDPKVNVLEAIGQAGGLTEFADGENIKLVRNEGGKARVYKLNVLEDNLLLSDKFFLQPNDIILVNQLKNRSQNQQRLSTISLLVSVITSLGFVIIQATR
jgi:polysaccharide biosynthesis/export protein